MNDTTKLIEALIAAKTPADLIAQVVQLSAEAASVKKYRAANAVRQREWRQRNVMSRNVTLVTLHNAQHIDKKEEDKKRKKVSIALPENWWPSDADQAFARKQGWAEEKIKLEAHRFIDHAKANNRRQADWPAAWRNWVTSPYQTKGNGNGHGRQLQDDRLSVGKAIERLGQSDMEFGPRPTLVPATSPNDRRLLPKG